MAQTQTEQSEDMLSQLEWIEAWEKGLLRKVLETFREIKTKYPTGVTTLKLTYHGGAFIFETTPPLGSETQRRYTAVDFDDDFDIEQCLEDFKARVAALFP
jgi:hypothetical protein